MNQPDRSGAATRANARVALVTCAALPQLDADDRLLLAPLARLGITGDPVIWDDDRAEWDRYDLAVLRSPWDYALRRKEFVGWAAAVPRLLNAASVVAWNTDKRYLAVLAAAGVPVVPTAWLAPGDGWSPEPVGEYVIKPTVSAGSRDTSRYDLTDPARCELARAHVDRLHADGRSVMVQPYLHRVDTVGETALIYLGGRYSHAIRKGPMLPGRQHQHLGPDEALYRHEDIQARVPGPGGVGGRRARPRGVAVPPVRPLVRPGRPGTGCGRADAPGTGADRAVAVPLDGTRRSRSAGDRSRRAAVNAPSTASAGSDPGQ
jgi:hypothetical protein